MLHQQSKASIYLQILNAQYLGSGEDAYRDIYDDLPYLDQIMKENFWKYKHVFSYEGRSLLADLIYKLMRLQIYDTQQIDELINKSTAELIDQEANANDVIGLLVAVEHYWKALHGRKSADSLTHLFAYALLRLFR